MNDQSDPAFLFDQMDRDLSEYREDEAADEVERATKKSEHEDFRAVWLDLWERFMGYFDTSASNSDTIYRLNNPNEAASILAEIGKMTKRLNEVRTDIVNYNIAERLRNLANSKEWSQTRNVMGRSGLMKKERGGVGGKNAAGILYAAAFGKGTEVLASILKSRDEDNDRRTAFCWMEFYRDQMLPPFLGKHWRIRIWEELNGKEVLEADPKGKANKSDIELVKRWLNDANPWGNQANEAEDQTTSNPQPNHKEAAPDTAHPPASGVQREGKKATKGKNINARMAVMIQSDSTKIEWTVRMWAENLGCSTSTVTDTHTWQQTIKAARALNKVGRMQSPKRK